MKRELNRKKKKKKKKNETKSIICNSDKLLVDSGVCAS